MPRAKPWKLDQIVCEVSVPGDRISIADVLKHRCVGISLSKPRGSSDHHNLDAPLSSLVGTQLVLPVRSNRASAIRASHLTSNHPAVPASYHCYVHPRPVYHYASERHCILAASSNSRQHPAMVRFALCLLSPSFWDIQNRGCATPQDSLQHGTHWITIYKVASSENPEVTLVRVFLPSRAHWLTSMDEGLLWIFQWDWIIFALCHVIPALTTIYDIQRLVPDIDDDPEGDKIFKGFYMTVALTVLGGPGAALAGVWGWREEC
jgi:hypothetical protein